MIEAAVVHTQGSRLKVHLLLTQVNAEAWLPWVINLGPRLGFREVEMPSKYPQY